MEKHCAYNLLTGEVIACSTNRGLKRRVRLVNQISRNWDYPIGKWVFSHKGINALMEKVKTKYAASI